MGIGYWMSPRSRMRKNRELPDNLYRVRKDSDRYWEYRNPVSGKRVKFTASKTEAIRQAKSANAKLAMQTDLGDRLVGVHRDTVAYAIQRFRREHLAHQHMSDTHRDDWKWRLRKMEREIGSLVLAEIKTRDLFNWLRPMPDRTANMHRTRMVQVFQWCMSVGLMDWNPAEPLLIRQERKTRQPITDMRTFLAIYRHANRPTRMAMGLCLRSLQRRADIAEMRVDHVVDGYLCVHQSKTGKRLMLPMTPGLSKAVRRCKLDHVFSPYLVHQTTGNKKRQGKPLSPASISRGFQRARDASGLFDHLDERERPTFHEILGLAEHILREAGWTTEEIQAWRGHESPSMTEHYMAGHEHWEVIKPGGFS